MTFYAELRWYLMVFCVLIFAIAFTLMVVSAWVHHSHDKKDSTNFHKSIFVELCWALAPLTMVVLLIWPTARQILKA
jgi:cytochrome c oxidase subunit 2